MIRSFLRLSTFIFIFGGGVMFWGCSSSEDSMKSFSPETPPQPSATEVMTNTVNTLKAQNDSLKQRIVFLEQSNRSSVARSAELETQLNDLKSKAPPPVIAKTPSRPQPAPLRTSNADEAYQEALQLFRSRSYEEAAGIFQQLLDANAAEDLMDNCRYWLGECAYATKHYQEAIEHFRKVFDYQVSEKKDDAQIMIAHSYYAMGDTANAKKEYTTFIEKFPASPYVKRAKERLGKL